MRQPRFLVLTAVLAMLVGLVLSACGSSGSDSTGSAELDPDNPTKATVVAEWSFYAAHAPVVVAVQKGFYEELGLEVDFIAPAAPGDQVKYLTGNRAQIALTQPMEVPLSRSKGIPLKIFGALFDKNPTGLMTTPDGITDPKEFAGQTIGSSGTPDAVGSIATMMEELGIDDFTEVNVGESGVPLLLEGKVAAVHALDPGEYALLNDETGEQFNFFDYTEYGVPDYPLLSWVALDDYMESNPAVLEAFLAGTQKGLEEVETNQAALKEAMDFIKSENNVFTSEQHDAIEAETPPFWAKDPAVDPKVIEETAEWMSTVDVNGSPWLAEDDIEPVEEYVTDEFVPSE